MFRHFAESLQSLLPVSVVAALFFFTGLAVGQVNPGTPAWSAYDSHAVDTINLQNLSVSLSVPIMSKTGAFPFNFALTGGDSYVYSNGSNLNAGVIQTPLTPSANGVVGFVDQVANSGAVVPNVSCPSGDGSGTATEYKDWYVLTADGTHHPLPTTDVSYYGTSCSSSFTDQAIDGSGYTLSVTGNVVTSVYSSNGMSLSVTQAKDSNGNKISFKSGLPTNTFTDTLGLTALLWNNSTGVFSWTDINGGSPSVTPTYTSYTIRSAFECTGLPDYNQPSIELPTKFDFPDTTNLTLAWETTPGYSSDRTGRLSTVTLRTHGTVTYNYNPSSGPNDGLDCTYQVPNQMTRTTSDGTTTYTWAAVNNGSNNWGNTTTVVDNGGNKTVYTFTGLTSSVNAALPITQALTQVQHYQGLSTLLTTDVYCYNGAAANCATQVVSLPVTEVDVYHTINGMSTSSRTQTKYDKYGNVTYSAQYDFGASSPTVATTTTYGSWNGSTCVAIGSNVNNKPCTIATTNLGYNVGLSRLTYDSKGNRTAKSVWAGASTYLTSSATYNGNGTPATTTSVGGIITSYTYGDCNGLLPTKVSSGGLNNYTTWNCVGGVPLTKTDANDPPNVTTIGYTAAGVADPFWRVRSVTDPLGTSKTFTYSATSSYGGPETASALVFGSTIESTATNADTFGRPVASQTSQGPGSSGYDTVSTSYGWASTGRSVSSSQPCSVAAGGSCPIAKTTIMNALGQVVSQGVGSGVLTNAYNQNDVLATLSPAPSGEKTKNTQKQFDGLGRITSSCSILSSGGSSCGQNTAASGIPTTFLYAANPGITGLITTRGSQQRNATSDAAGRLIYTIDPESGQTTYYYDSMTSDPCTGGAYTFTGKLLEVLNANGSYVCYMYDGLGRINNENIWPGGSGYGDYCARFRYDSQGSVQPIPSGATINNPYGHVFEAETDNCSGTMIADEWFSYDADGRVTDTWEETLSSGVYYHSKNTYYPDGQIATVTLVSPTSLEFSYGLDGEGRPYSMVEPVTDQTFVSSTTYTAAHQPSVVSYVSPDTDTYTYSSSTGQMTSYSFNVGGTTDSAGMVWNANQSLASIGVTDGFGISNLGCAYTYDDIGRLVNNACNISGSAAPSQTFSYDIYDNLTKTGTSGGVSWNPGYSATNNQYTSTGTTYDASGNILSDPTNLHTYSWTGLGRIQSIDSAEQCGTSGICVYYDAFGRKVDVVNGTTHVQIWYTPMGRVFMSGSTLGYAYVSMPGGGTLAYVPGTGDFLLHKDWLGNVRLSSYLNAHTMAADYSIAPYGELTGSGTTALGQQMFTGSTEDLVQGIYDAEFREYTSAQGRWLSPDPARSGWNRYAYPTNPLSSLDPSGLFRIGPWYFLGAQGLNSIGSALEASAQYFGIDSDAFLINPATGTVEADADSTSPGPGSSLAGLNMNFSAGASMLAGLPTTDFNLMEINAVSGGGNSGIDYSDAQDGTLSYDSFNYLMATDPTLRYGVMVFGMSGGVDVFDGYAPGQGFSGVYDTATGNMALSPSTYETPVPDGYVSAQGGHADVSAALGGDQSTQYGFAAIIQEDGSIQLTWKSGVLNPPPNYTVPQNVQAQIVQAVQQQTGLNVIP